ncbi:MAG: FAD-dependent oxidoreductase [Candidatus Sumerlaeia bacterium]
MPKPRILIIGAGPAGLGAAWRLRELGCSNFAVLEQNTYPGGLAASFRDRQGFTWDIGGHVLFSHYPFVDRAWDEALDGQWSHFERSAWVRLYDRWIPYPFQNNLRHLPPDAALECVMGLIEATRDGSRSPDTACNFLEWSEAVFGRGICRHFMNPYNRKTWGVPLEMMAKDWIAERVSVVRLEDVLRHIIEGQDRSDWGPNARFRFPLRGGTGAIYAGLSRKLADFIRFGRRVAAIHWEKRQITLADGAMEHYDALLSAAPLTELVQMLEPRVQALDDAARRLVFTGGIFHGIGLRQPCPSSRCWVYFPEDKTPNYRVTYFSNYSPHNTPGPEFYSLLCETSWHPDFLPRDPTASLEATIRGLIATGLLREQDRADIVSTWQHEIRYSYPVPTLDRNAALLTIIPWLEHHGIHSRGRFGLWCYEIGNMDHAMEQGKEVVDVLLGLASDQPILPDFLKAALNG